MIMAAIPGPKNVRFNRKNNQSGKPFEVQGR
jgi:hypothetical protein